MAKEHEPVVPVGQCRTPFELWLYYLADLSRKNKANTLKHLKMCKPCRQKLLAIGLGAELGVSHEEFP